MTVGLAGRKETLTACVSEAAIPELLRKSALEPQGGQLDFASDVFTIRNHGLGVPLKANEMGHYVLSVVSSGEGPPRSVRGPKLMASYCGRAFVDTRPEFRLAKQLP